MKEYKKYEDKKQAAGEPLPVYASPSLKEKGVPSVLMDELMNQPDEIKLYIISRLAESMKHKTKENPSFTTSTESPDNAIERQKQLEAKRNYYRQKYNLPENLIRLIGCLPSHTDEEREKAKEEYLMEKYGRS